MKIPITELKDKVTAYLLANGFSQRDATTLMELVVEQELVGNQFSAVGELPGKHSRIIDNVTSNEEEVVVIKPALKLIKGNGRSAPLIIADIWTKLWAKQKTKVFMRSVFTIVPTTTSLIYFAAVWQLRIA